MRNFAALRGILKMFDNVVVSYYCGKSSFVHAAVLSGCCVSILHTYGMQNLALVGAEVIK
jgi:hypothetical protein